MKDPHFTPPSNGFRRWTVRKTGTGRDGWSVCLVSTFGTGHVHETIYSGIKIACLRMCRRLNREGWKL